MIDQTEIRDKLLDLCDNLKRMTRKSTPPVERDYPDTERAWSSGWRNGWKKAVEQFEHKVTKLLTVEVCVDPRHDEPCPLPCQACDEECDKRRRRKL